VRIGAGWALHISNVWIVEGALSRPASASPGWSTAEEEGLDTVLFEQMEESVAAFRCDATYLYVNSAAERVFGIRREKVVGRVLWELFPRVVGGPFHQAFLRVVQTGRKEEFEHLYEPWGRWFRNRLYRSGERIFAFAREITEERLRETERAESIEFTERLYEQTRLAEQRSAFLALASEVLTSSLEREEILRRLARLAVPTLGDWCAVDEPGPDGQVRRVVVEHVQPERVAQALALLVSSPVQLDAPAGIGKVLRTGTTEFVPELTDALIDPAPSEPERRRDTRELGLSSYICVPLVSRGRVFAALTLAHADSHRRYTEADVRLAEDLARRAATCLDNGLLYKEARDAIRARDSFLSVASHELNTPLTSLSLNLQALQRALQRAMSGELPPDAVGAKLQTMQRQISRLKSLIHELLDVSRITAGKLRLEPEEVDLAGLVRELASRFSDDLARAGCELRLELPGEVLGCWDRLRMEQILQNLLSNAIKYGRGRPIELRLTADEQWARLTVRDQGIGISPEDQARLFQRFERLASERHYSGFGLGLWIVKQILDAMRGRILVESELERGSRFTVELPRQAPPIC
jgi:PAS domain S-box-containing protein